MELEPELLGIDTSDPVIAQFWEDHMIKAKMVFIPKKIEQELTNISSRLRMAHRRKAIEFPLGDGKEKLTFMTLEMAKEFEKESVQVCKDLYFRQLEEIMKDFPNIKASFRNGVNSFFSTKTKKKKFEKQLEAMIPEEIDYEESFHMSFDTWIMDISDKPEVVDRFLAQAIQLIFDRAVALEKSFNKNGRIPSKTLGSISGTIKDVKEVNIIENKEIEDLMKEFETISSRGGKGAYVKSAIDRLKNESYNIASRLGIVKYVKFF